MPTQKQLCIAAGVALVVIGLMNVNEASRRAFNFDGFIQTWIPLLGGGFVLFATWK